MGKKWRLLSLYLLVTLTLSGCGEPFISTLRPAGEVAEDQFYLMILSTAIMVAVVIVVMAIFTYVLIKFRRSKSGDTELPKQVEGNKKLEILWTVIPILLLVILGVPTVTHVFGQADTKVMDQENRNPEEALVINVRANLYWWEFEYPDYGIITSQELVVPTDERVYFQLKASDVKHSFWIPSAGGKMDTNTENDNRFFLTFDSKKNKDAGEYFFGKCAELCGPSHALMDFKVKPLSKEDFKQWVSKMENYDTTSAATASSQGEKLFEEKNCLSCHAVSPKDERPEAARTGPNLATFGERSKIAGVKDFNDENLHAWLKDPGSVKPGNKMTDSYGELSEEEIAALSEYLKGLKTE